MLNRHKVLGAWLAVLLAIPSSSAWTAERLRVVGTWDRNFYSIEILRAWITEFRRSEAAKTVGIRLRFLGGPEVTPAPEQMTAVRNGVFDMMFGAAGYYLGRVPEGAVLYASEFGPTEARERGALDVLDQIYQERAGVKLLAWLGGEVGYHLWTIDKPSFGPDGMPDLTGLKIRSSPLYEDWLRSLGATPVSIEASGLYTALDRGVVTGAAWPGMGIQDIGFHTLVNYRVGPPVWRFDNILVIDLDRWNALSPEQQDTLADAALAFERRFPAALEKHAAEEEAAITEADIERIRLEGIAAQRYREAAAEVHWQDIEEKAPENYKRLRRAFMAQGD